MVVHRGPWDSKQLEGSGMGWKATRENLPYVTVYLYTC